MNVLATKDARLSELELKVTRLQELEAKVTGLKEKDLPQELLINELQKKIKESTEFFPNHLSLNNHDPSIGRASHSPGLAANFVQRILH